MPSTPPEVDFPPFMSVKQVAEYLQLHEKKVYTLANEGKIPATKVTGKWLFPRHLIDQWLLESSYGGVLTDRLVIVGSDDPLLYRLVMNIAQEVQDQALISYTCTGTQLGLSLLSRRRADVCCIHWGLATESHLRHPALLQNYPAYQHWLLVRAFEREQGLMLNQRYAQHAHQIKKLLQMELRWAVRQAGAGSQRFLFESLARHQIEFQQLTVTRVAYSEREAASFIATQQADIAPGTRSAAAEFGLAFVPMDWEAFDLVLNRSVYFRTLFQSLLAQFKTPNCQAVLQSLSGYRLQETGKIIWSSDMQAVK